MEVYQGNNLTPDSKPPTRFEMATWQKWLVGIIGFLVLLAMAFFFFFIRNSDSSEIEDPLVDVQAQDIETDKIKIDNIVYGYGETFESPANVFARNLEDEDSERKSLIDLENVSTLPYNSFGSNLLGFDVSKNYATIVNEKDIWVGKYNSNPEINYTHEPANSSQRLVACTITRDGSKVAFAVKNETAKTASLWILDVASNTSRMLTDNIKGAPFAWSDDNKTIYLGPNVFGSSDGKPVIPQSFKVDSSETTDLFESKADYDFEAYAISPNGNYVAYVQATVDRSKKDSNFQGFYVGKPYGIYLRDTDNGQITALKDINTDTPPQSLLFDVSSENLYWAEGDTIYEYGFDDMIVQEKYSTTAEDINALYAGSNGILFAGSKMADKSIGVYRIDLRSRNRTLITNATDTTTAVGFTFRE